MKISQYVSAEKAIAAADSSGIRERLLYGLRLLNDPEAMSEGGGGLRQGVTEKLIAGAQARGLNLSAAELRDRILCAKTYRTESQIANAVSDLGTWHNLRQARFPGYPAEPGEPPIDYRNPAEKHRARARNFLEQLGEHEDEQGTLFPLDRFEPAETILKDLVDYAEKQRAITDSFAKRDEERAAYLEKLIDAVDGDLSQTWQAAHSAAYGTPSLTVPPNGSYEIGTPPQQAPK